MQISHINPNCRDSTRCRPHGEIGPVEYIDDAAMLSAIACPRCKDTSHTYQDKCLSCGYTTERNTMHTPTPWCTEPGTGTLEIWRVDSSDLIATLDIPSAVEGPTVQANAHFIVTAANTHAALVEALQTLLEFATDAAAFIQSVDASNNDESGIEAYEPSEEQNKAFQQARDALRQARGDA